MNARRNPGSRRAPTASNQWGFDFDAPAPAEPSAAKPVAALNTATPITPATPSPAPTPDLEALARTLEAHPDYRVLRRLAPRWDFGPRPEPHDPAGVQRVLVLDTETTGLQPGSDKIIELAMLWVQVDCASGLPFGPVAVFEGFEDPGMPIPAVARQVTGISDEMVRGQRLDDAAVQAMVTRADVVVAHNAAFDRPFVEARWACFADKAWACSFADVDWKAAGAGSAKLSALAQDQGWFYDAHRAQVDCHALLQVLACPVGGGGHTGLALLLAAAAAPSFRLRATGAAFERKDLLRERGYRWDAEARVWACTLTTSALLEAELAWLKGAVYGGRSARLVLEVLESRVRYSGRLGVVSDCVL